MSFGTCGFESRLLHPPAQALDPVRFAEALGSMWRLERVATFFLGDFGEARWGCKGLFLCKTLIIDQTGVFDKQEVNFRGCTFFHNRLLSGSCAGAVASGCLVWFLFAFRQYTKF